MIVSWIWRRLGSATNASRFRGACVFTADVNAGFHSETVRSVQYAGRLATVRQRHGKRGIQSPDDPMAQLLV